MSNFEVKVVQVTVNEHPNADALDLVAVGGFRAVSMKGRFQTGDWALYVPENALIPTDVLKQEGFWNVESEKGILGGKRGNRVRPVKLRGALSEGIMFKPAAVNTLESGVTKFTFERDGKSVDVTAEDDLAEFFGITKYMPPIPTNMDGAVVDQSGLIVKFDIENVKKFPDVIEKDELVVMTEKLHGTYTQIGYIPDSDTEVVASKGLGCDKGLGFVISDENMGNLYVKTALAETKENPSLIIKTRMLSTNVGDSVYLMGEIFGNGVQDLKYGTDEPTFRLFDIYVGRPGVGRFMDWAELVNVAKGLNIPLVPVIYSGVFNEEILLENTVGRESVSGKGVNLREGIVVKPQIERSLMGLGRVILKSISPKYLMRKGETTELQ